MHMVFNFYLNITCTFVTCKLFFFYRDHPTKRPLISATSDHKFIYEIKYLGLADHDEQ